MGFSVNEHSQPERKLLLWEKRLGRLRAAIKAVEGPGHVDNAAEKLRLAALAVIKAKLALIREYPRRDPTGRQASHLLDEDRRWRALSTRAIVEEHGRSDETVP